jgi:hypothetical protein
MTKKSEEKERIKELVIKQAERILKYFEEEKEKGKNFDETLDNFIKKLGDEWGLTKEQRMNIRVLVDMALEKSAAEEISKKLEEDVWRMYG